MKAPTARRKRAAAAQPSEPRFLGRRIEGRGKVSSKGWVVIPKAIRDEMGIAPGDEVTFALVPPPPYMKQDRGLYALHVYRVPEDSLDLITGMFPWRPGQPLWTEALVEEHRREVEEDEREFEEYKRRSQRTSA